MNKELKQYIESVAEINESNLYDYDWSYIVRFKDSSPNEMILFKLERKFNYQIFKLQSGEYNVYRMHDYHDFCDLDTPKQKRKKFSVGDIYDNSIECLVCGDKPRSKNRTHMSWCQCGTVAIDGGSNYVRIIGNSDNYKSNTILFNDVEK